MLVTSQLATFTFRHEYGLEEHVSFIYNGLQPCWREGCCCQSMQLSMRAFRLPDKAVGMCRRWHRRCIHQGPKGNYGACCRLGRPGCALLLLLSQTC